jgi:hypothetical protein
MEQKDCFLSLVRSVGRIKAKVNHRQHDFKPPDSKDMPKWNELYQTVSVSLKAIPKK